MQAKIITILKNSSNGEILTTIEGVLLSYTNNQVIQIQETKDHKTIWVRYEIVDTSIEDEITLYGQSVTRYFNCYKL